MATNGSKVGTSTESLMNSTPFVGGLNTELSGIIDSTEFTKDELNMMIRPDGTRSRRPGVDYEEAYKFGEQAYADVNDSKWAFEAIEWYDVAGPDEAVGYDGQPYIVVQNGSKLQFFLNKGQPYSGNESEFSLDLTQYKLSGKTNQDVARARCKFTTAYGSIFICSDAIGLVQLRKAQNQQATPIPQSSAASTRVSVQVGNAHSSRWRGIYYGEPHYPERGFWIDFYLNGVLIKTVTAVEWYGSQGTSDNGPYFWCSTQIAQMWNVIDSTTRMGITATPLYADATPIRLGIHDNTNNTDITTRYDSAGPADYVTFTAPVSSGYDYRGYTIELRCYGWGKKLGSYAWSQKGTFAGGTTYQNSQAIGLTIRDTSVGAEDFLGIQSSPSKMSYAHLYNVYNQGWTNDLLAKYYVNQSAFPANNLAQQYLKDDKTTAFKPEALINTTFGNTPAARGHVILNYFTQDRKTAGGIVSGMSDLVNRINTEYTAQGSSTRVTIDDIRDKLGSTADTEDGIATDQVPVYKPTAQNITDIIAYAGRIFYLVGDVLLYSQVISEDTTRANLCYTDADPTSEELSDVVETDGGLISLPDIGEGVNLAQVGQYLLVFGTRGNVAITGTTNNIFTATAYSAGSLNAVPSQAPQSFVNTEFGLLYWGTTGITFIANANEGLAVQDLSTQKILTWYGKLNNTQHKYCKGVYSSSKKKVYWFYPSDEEKPCRLDCCLVYDLQRNSFAPQKIVTEVESTDDTEMVYTAAPEIVSGLSLKTPFRADREYPIEGESTRIDISASPYLIWNEPAIHAGSDFPVVFKNTEIWHSTPEADFTVEYEGQHVLTSGSNNEGNVYIIDTITSSGGISTQTVDTYCEYKGVLRPFSTATVTITPGVPPSVRINCPSYTMYAGYCSAENTEGDATTLSDVYIIDKEAKVGDKFYMVINDKVKEVGYITQAGFFGQEGKDYEQNGVLEYFKGYFTDGTIPDPNAFEDDVYISTTTEVTWNVRISGYEPGSTTPIFVTYEVPERTSRVYLQTRENKVLEVAPYTGEVLISQDNPIKVLADDPISSEAFTYESSILVCLDKNNSKITFGDFRNNNMRDWTAGDWQGPGYIFDSYLISHPMNANGYSQFSGNRKSDIVHSKNMPYLLSYFRRTETGPLIGGGYVYPSACQGSILWDWRTSGRAGKWSSPTDLYRPYKDTIFDNGFIVNKTNIRGLGRAYQVKLESVEDNQFILEGLVFDLKNDGRI